MFCCYDYSVNASEAVQKIATDQKDITNVPHVLSFVQQPKYVNQEAADVEQKKGQ